MSHEHRRARTDTPFASTAPPEVSSGSPYFLVDERPTPLLPTEESRDATAALFHGLYDDPPARPLEKPVPYLPVEQLRAKEMRERGEGPPPSPRLVPGHGQPPYVEKPPAPMEGKGLEPPPLLTKPFGVKGAVESTGKEVMGGLIRGAGAGLSNPAKEAPKVSQPVGPSGPIYDEQAFKDAEKKSHRSPGPIDELIEAIGS